MSDGKQYCDCRQGRDACTCKPPIAYGQLTQQQRLDVARGEKLNVECNCSWNPDRHADDCPVNLLDRLTDAQRLLSQLREELAQRDAEIGRLNKRVVALEAGPLPRGWREVIDQARESIGAGAPGEYAQTERAAVEPYLDGLYDEFDALESQQAASVGGDASELQRVIYNADYNAKRMLDSDSFWWSEIATIRVEFERFMRSRAALSPAGGGVAVPEGYAIVPNEPTAETEEAGCQAYMDADNIARIMHRSSMGHSYRAMICQIGIVGEIDGHEVIRRNSAIEVVEQVTRLNAKPIEEA